MNGTVHRSHSRSRSIRSNIPTGLCSPRPCEFNATSSGSIRCRTAANRRFEISATSSFQGEFVPFHFELDFVVDIKVVPCVVLYIVVKFVTIGGHERRRRRWSRVVVAPATVRREREKGQKRQFIPWYIPISVHSSRTPHQ